MRCRYYVYTYRMGDIARLLSSRYLKGYIRISLSRAYSDGCS